MSRKITFGVSLRQGLAMRDPETFDADRYADLVRAAEELGYDQVLLADHVFVPSYWAGVIGDLFLEPFALLSYLAARTTRIELVVSCLVVPYRQPFTTAKMVATIDQLAGGRLVLGVVPGYLKEEFETFGLPRQQRGAMTNEFVRIMIELWTNGAATYEGRYYRCEGVNMKPKCARRPHVPIWVGGSSQGAMRRVAEFGNAWHPLGFQVVEPTYLAEHQAEFVDSMQTCGTTPERLREGLDHIRRLAEKSGRDLVGLQVVVNPGSRLAAEGGGGSLERSGPQIALGGDRVVEWLGQYVEAGATGFSVSFPGASVEECTDNMERFAAEVVPLL